MADERKNKPKPRDLSRSDREDYTKRHDGKISEEQDRRDRDDKTGHGGPRKTEKE